MLATAIAWSKSTMKTEEPAILHELSDFLSGRIDPAGFPHREHVRLAYEMLSRHPFPQALLLFSKGLRLLAGRAGHPEKYNETITTAFLALIGEARLRRNYESWEEFSRDNSRLLRKDLLSCWYDSAMLDSERARLTFLLPPLANSRR
jgi:hypothetical protein